MALAENKIDFRRLGVLGLLGLLLLMGGLSSCATSRYGPASGRGTATGVLKDNNPSLWISDHPEIRRFRNHYSRTKTVRTALNNGRRYLSSIIRTFQSRGLPAELAYLPMLESLFKIRADSGHAKGMWQFTPQTAKHVGLRVGAMVDERMNWRKATNAAADYLEALGREFGYDWGLALSAYNGGPNYLKKLIARQGTRDIFKLSMRRETQEYVPRFVAMLQVAREKYGHLAIASR